MSQNLIDGWFTISAIWGGKAEAVIREMTKPRFNSHITREVIGRVGEDTWECMVTPRDGWPRLVRLVLGARVGLHLLDLPSDKWSCKPHEFGCLPIGSGVHLRHVPGIANNILACWACGSAGLTNAKVAPPPPLDPDPGSRHQKRRRRRSGQIGFSRWDCLVGY